MLCSVYGDVLPIFEGGERFVRALVVGEGLFKTILTMKDVSDVVVQAGQAALSPKCVKICRALSEAAKARSYSPRRMSGWMELLSVRAASFQIFSAL